MKILFLDHARTVVSGAEFRLLDLARALPAHAITPIVACDPASPLGARLDAAGVAHVPAVFPGLQSNRTLTHVAANGTGLVRVVAQLVRAVRTAGADVVHANTLLTRLPSILAGRLCRRPVIWHVRDVVVQPAWRRLYRTVGRLVDRVITVSDAVRTEFPHHPRMRTIYNGLALERYEADRDRARQWLGVDASMVVVGLAGALTPWKGHEIFLDAARLVSRRSSEPLLFVVAGGHLGDADRRAALERHAAALDLRDRVRFTGFCDDVPRLLSALDIAVTPSLRPDPLPGSVLEAMAVTRPVIASRIGGIPEIVDDGVTGVLVPPGDAHALADSLQRLIEAPARCADMGRAGRATIERRFRLDTSVRHLVEVYASL
jgi:glycosyltransferase involved in cell wall biosynthesis